MAALSTSIRCERGSIDATKSQVRSYIGTKEDFLTSQNDAQCSKPQKLVLCNSSSIDSKDVSYVALSPQWSQYSHDEKEIICTHEANRYQRENGFDMLILSKMFQDAVDVTRKLGKRYLWIDSLYIIQSLDDTVTEDW